MNNNKVKDKERNDKAVYRKGFNDKVESNKAKVLESRFLQNRNDDVSDVWIVGFDKAETPLHPLSLTLSNLLAKHHAVHHTQLFSY